jgi:hypothetical protein
MANSAIINVDGITLPNTIPQVQYDPVISATGAGAIGVWDAKNPKSWPSQAAPASGANSWLNLVRGGASATIPTTWTWQAQGGFVRPGVAATSIDLGAPDLSTGSPGVVVSAWVKIPSVPTALTPIAGRAQSTSAAVDNQFLLSIGADGKPRLDIMMLDADGATIRYATLSGPNVITTGVHQIGFSVTFSAGTGSYALYLDGAQIAASTFPGAKLNPSTYSIALGDRRVGNGGGSTTAGYVYYRALPENLTASGRTGAQVVAADWAAFNGKFS